MNDGEDNDGLYYDEEYLTRKENRRLMHRANLEARLGRQTDPSRAWVIFSVHSDVGKAYFDAAPAIWEKFHSVAGALSAEERETEIEKAQERLIKETGGLTVTKMQQVAFSNRELAEMVADFMEGTEGPVLLPISSITVPIDKYKEEVLDGKQPFEVMLLNGDLFEVWGFGCEERDITEIHDIHVKIGTTVQFSGTFWAVDSVLAVQDAMKLYEQYESDGRLR